ncbi:MAG: GNAT family N-acetyltransferase [Rectinemataceae bacterium]
MERNDRTGHENQEGCEASISLRKLREEDIPATLALIREYVAWIGEDLSFQGLEKELGTFPHSYDEPGGAFLVAIDSGEPVACVGLRRLDAKTREMKRLFVRDSHKGRGIGQQLLTRIIEEARAKGYLRMRLDTLPKMGEAQRLYERWGFRDIDPYTDNPLPGARFMELPLSKGTKEGGVQTGKTSR